MINLLKGDEYFSIAKKRIENCIIKCAFYCIIHTQPLHFGRFVTY